MAKGKIFITASHFETLCKEAEKLIIDSGYEPVVYKSESPYISFEEIAEVIPDIDGVIVGFGDWTEEVYKLAPKLKAIAKFGVGTDNIDKVSAKKYGIKVMNAPGMNSNAVAELVIGLIFDMLRGISKLNNDLHEGNWVRAIGEELTGKTVGLLGFGAIAKLVAKKLQSMDVTVIATDLYPDYETAKKYGVRLTTQDEVIEKSDILSIHIPATAENHHMFNDEMFARMKKGAYFVNAARGALVDSEALVRALKSGQIKFAALDAFENEPLQKDDELNTCGKVICLPHTGAETEESYGRVSMCVAQDVIAVLEGREPKFCVNK